LKGEASSVGYTKQLFRIFLRKRKKKYQFE
jgi:hypothetical protein